MKPNITIDATNFVTEDDLAELRLLAGANIAAAAYLLRECPVLTLSKDEVLLRPDTPNHTLYVLLRGRMRVHLGSLRSEPIYIIEPGETVGEMSIVGEEPSPAYVIADEFARVLCIEQEVFWSLVYTEHAIARNVLWMVVERMRASRALMHDGLLLRQHPRSPSKLDDLTGVHNREVFENMLHRQMMRCVMGDKSLTLMIVGIDGILRFVREFGVEAGNQAVSVVAKVLHENLRPTDLIGRMSESQFGVVLSECNAEAAAMVAKRICGEIAESVIEMADASILPPITVSVGIAEASDSETGDSLIVSALESLTLARKRNCHVTSD